MVSSIGAMSMPRWAKISQSNFRFCPILSTERSSSSGFSSFSASCSASWSGASSPANSPAPPPRRPADGQRHVAGLVGREPSEKPQSSACIGSRLVVSVSNATTPTSRARAIQCVETLERAHGLVARPVDLARCGPSSARAAASACGVPSLPLGASRPRRHYGWAGSPPSGRAPFPVELRSAPSAAVWFGRVRRREPSCSRPAATSPHRCRQIPPRAASAR